MFKISKTFKAEMGHIVTTQKLPDIYPCKCKNFHGHSFKFIAEIYGKLNPETGMLIDYTMLASFKNFIDNFFDHSFIVSGRDKGELQKLILLQEMLLHADYPKVELTYQSFLEPVIKHLKLHYSDIVLADELSIQRKDTVTVIDGVSAVTAETLSVVLSAVLANELFLATSRYKKFVGEIQKARVIVKETENTDAACEPFPIYELTE
jgi:6-pyruvoyl-tetrahydropterin synthase